MKTFYQLVEAIEKHELENKEEFNIKNILNKIDNKEDIVRYALYCAEDCFRFNNDTTRNAAQNCINLVKKWLDAPDTVTIPQLENVVAQAQSIVMTVDGNMRMGIAARQAVQSAYCAANTVYDSSRALYADSCAVYAFFYGNREDDSIREQKGNEYRAYALSLLRTSSVKEKNKIINYKGKIGDKGKPTGRLTSKMDIFALLDTFIDHGDEDIITKVGNEFHLNFPSGMVISGKTMNEIVDKIWENQAVLHYLEKLYKQQ